uniref:Eyes absent homolog n=1 Tax=Timema tahoe TaxID=61484 RepID=A0A7R9IBC3_9NEOP|nr:unnamed protein product [Timema tahoe]
MDPIVTNCPVLGVLSPRDVPVSSTHSLQEPAGSPVFSSPSTWPSLPGDTNGNYDSLKTEVRSPGVEASLSQSEALYSDSLGSYTDSKDYSQHPYASQYYSSMQQAYGSQSYMQGSSFYNSAAAYGVLPQGYSSGGKLYSDSDKEHTKT